MAQPLSAVLAAPLLPPEGAKKGLATLAVLSQSLTALPGTDTLLGIALCPPLTTGLPHQPKRIANLPQPSRIASLPQPSKKRQGRQQQPDKRKKRPKPQKAPELLPRPSPAALPPGLNLAFVRKLARETRCVSHRELLYILAATWRICCEEDYPFLPAIAQIRAESDFNRRLVSSAGAIGLMQILPTTGRYMGFADVHGVENNIRCGIRYMRYLERYIPRLRSWRERWVSALACYNSGPGNYTSILKRTRRRTGSARWKRVARTYRQRYRRVPGHRDPEPVIYIRRCVRTWKRFCRHLLSSQPSRKA